MKNTNTLEAIIAQSKISYFSASYSSKPNFNYKMQIDFCPVEGMNLQYTHYFNDSELFDNRNNLTNNDAKLILSNNINQDEFHEILMIFICDNVNNHDLIPMSFLFDGYLNSEDAKVQISYDNDYFLQLDIIEDEDVETRKFQLQDFKKMIQYIVEFYND